VGASIGAWRFAAACCGKPEAALADFARGYSEQRFPLKPSARYVSDSARALLNELFAGREEEILSSAGYRLHVLAVRGRWTGRPDTKLSTSLGFGMAAMANALGRRHLARFIERTVFHDARDRLPFRDRFDAFHTHAVPLVRGNLGEALMASASIPLVLEGVSGIPDAPPGTYWDGGIIDYHLHLPYHHAEGLVLYPHFTDRIVPGWLDKPMPWRRARGEWLDNVVLVSPSREYLARLPHGKLPDRGDFKRFAHDYEGRMKYWRHAMGESDRIAEAFLDFAARPDPSKVLPL
jgi:hypothetical protein